MNKLFDLLTICENEFIGTYTDPNIKYSLDIDIQEYIKNPLYLNKQKINDILNYIYLYFKNIFNISHQSKSFYITDFKCGVYNGKKLRWSYTEIMKGYKTFENIKPVIITFQQALQSKSIIKIDILYIDNNNIIKEITKNYYFVFNNLDTRTQIEDIERTLLYDIQKYKKIDYIKMVKRVYRYNKLKGKATDYLLKIINSKAGKIDYYLNQLELIEKFKSIKPLPKNYSKIIQDNLDWINRGIGFINFKSYKQLTEFKQNFKKNLLSNI